MGFFGPEPEKPSFVPPPEEYNWGLIAHLSSLVAIALGGMTFVGPLVVWLIKKDNSPFVEDQAKEALNFQLSVLIASLVCAATCVLAPVIIVIAIMGIVYPIIAGIAANKGEYYLYPYSIRLIK